MKKKFLKVFEVTMVILIVLAVFGYGAFEIWVRNYAEHEKIFYEAQKIDSKIAPFKFQFMMKLASKAGSSKANRILGDYYLLKRKYKDALIYFLKYSESHKNDLWNLGKIYECYSKVKNKEQAIKWLEKESSKGNLTASLALGNAYRDDDKFLAAIKCYERAIKSFPEKACIAIAKIYRVQKKYDNEIAILEKGIKLVPGKWQLYLELARTYHYQKKYDLAINKYIAAIEHGCWNSGSLLRLIITRCDYKKGEKIFLNLAKKMGKNFQRELGIIYLAQSKYKQARKALKSSNYNEEFQFDDIAFSYKFQQDYSQAAQYYLLKNNDNRVDGYYAIVKMYKNIGKFDQALFYAQEAESKQGAMLPEIIAMAGDIYFERKDYKLALEYYKKIFRRSNLDKITECYLILKDYDSYEKLLVKMKEKGGSDLYLEYKIKLLIHQGKINNAIEIINSLKHIPEHSKISYIGTIYIKAKNYEKALAQYQKLAQDPEIFAVKCIKIAELYEIQGKYELAIKSYEKLLSKIDDDAIAEKDPLYKIGLIYYKQGKYQQALEYLLKDLEQDCCTQTYKYKSIAEVYGKLGLKNKEREYLAKHMLLSEKVF
ncbi:tetratricopeptide repeat protein [Lentisphaerota bacterium WC36G]|nr:tetratricopeptide repeat protein [Lentisphaerae bacterium WC36]